MRPGRPTESAAGAGVGGDFDPEHLTTDASLNRLVIGGPPAVPARLAGRQAQTLLSAQAVAALAREHGIAVRREATADDLGAAMRTTDPARRTAALAVAAEVGLRLAWLLSTLRDPGTASAQGWNPWRRAYLRHWAAVNDVHLAGGLLAGDFGPAVVDGTNAALARLGVRTRTELMPWPACAALVGAARRLGVVSGDVMAMDLGGSGVRTALVRVLPDGAVELTRLSTTALPFDQLDQPTGDALEALLAGVLASAARDLQRLGSSARGVAVSVACYVGRDRRCAQRGVYANLPDLGDDAWRGRLRALFGRSVELGVVHDGTAAAASVPGAGGDPGATLVVGTALGVGFPPIGLPAWRALTVRGDPSGR
jgi:hypothetical protein